MGCGSKDIEFAIPIGQASQWDDARAELGIFKSNALETKLAWFAANIGQRQGVSRVRWFVNWMKDTNGMRTSEVVAK